MSSDQRELFQLPHQPPPARPDAAPIGDFQIRQDHAMLMIVGGLMSLSVVFALGVERGKQLVRTERPLLGQHLAAVQRSGQGGGATSGESPTQQTSPPERNTQPSSSTQPTGASERKSSPSPKAGSGPGSVPSAPKRTVSGPSRFAVQVVSYSRPQLAQRELQRLQQRGERAFLLMKQGTVALLVGPFPSKENARAKLAGLQQRYQGCFIRTL